MGICGRENSKHGCAPAGPQEPVHLFKPRLDALKVAKAESNRHDINRAIPDRHIQRIAFDQINGKPRRFEPFRCPTSSIGRQKSIPTVGAIAPSSSERSAVPQQRSTAIAPGRQSCLVNFFDDEPAPPLVYVERERVVEEVVARGYLRKHRPHFCGFARTGRGFLLLNPSKKTICPDQRITVTGPIFFNGASSWLAGPCTTMADRLRLEVCLRRLQNVGRRHRPDAVRKIYHVIATQSVKLYVEYDDRRRLLWSAAAL